MGLLQSDFLWRYQKYTLEKRQLFQQMIKLGIHMQKHEKIALI